MKDKIITYSFIIIFLAGVLYTLYLFAGCIVLKFSHKYTIGVTTGAGTSKGNTTISFNFRQSGKTYSGFSDGSIDPKRWKGTYYLVRYVPWYPRWSEMYFYTVKGPVDTSKISIPPDGWENIPEELKLK